jgi:CheY-like chemotaxis protein
MHILLIDDSSSTRSLLRTLINSGQAVQHQISEASSGEEALQKVGSGEIGLPDLIIVDINMAGMTGYDVCRAFREKHGGASDLVPYIIVVTANEGIDVINQALDAGANDYMPKPVNVKVLQVRLRVARHLLDHARAGSGATVDPRQALIAWAVELTETPIALVETTGNPPSFRILYTNAAMSVTTQYSAEQLLGQSLAELEAWTSEFMDMVVKFIDEGSALSHVPLWSATRQDNPVYISFYPVRSGEEPVTDYLAIHHL